MKPTKEKILEMGKLFEALDQYKYIIYKKKENYGENWIKYYNTDWIKYHNLAREIHPFLHEYFQKSILEITLRFKNKECTCSCHIQPRDVFAHCFSGPCCEKTDCYKYSQPIDRKALQKFLAE